MSWGMCETRATAWSCSAASNMTGVAPMSTARVRIVCMALVAVCSSVLITHGRPTNRSASAAMAPERSLPAIG